MGNVKISEDSKEIIRISHNIFGGCQRKLLRKLSPMLKWRLR